MYYLHQTEKFMGIEDNKKKSFFWGNSCRKTDERIVIKFQNNSKMIQGTNDYILV